MSHLRTLIEAANSRELLAQHQHDPGILRDTVCCPRCRAEEGLLAASRERLREARLVVPQDDRPPAEEVATPSADPPRLPFATHWRGLWRPW